MLSLLNTTLNGFLGLTAAFIGCELGQRANDAFGKISFTIEEINWCLFPSAIKRMLPAVIAIAQQPVTLECFGNIKCTREVFKKVGVDRSIKHKLKCLVFQWFYAISFQIIHHAYTYFMVLRQLEDWREFFFQNGLGNLILDLITATPVSIIAHNELLCWAFWVSLKFYEISYWSQSLYHLICVIHFLDNFNCSAFMVFLKQATNQKFLYQHSTEHRHK